MKSMLWAALTLLLVVMVVCMISLLKYVQSVGQRLERVEDKVDLIGVVQAEMSMTVFDTKNPEGNIKESTGEDNASSAETAQVEMETFDLPENASSEILYSFYNESDEYAMRVLTAEAGTDLEMCYAVAQCMFNACDYEGWEYSPAGICLQYGYTGPADWVSDEAAQAYDDIFCCGVTYLPVEDAQFFYATKYCDSSWHETMRFITEIHGVRFFGRWE